MKLLKNSQNNFQVSKNNCLKVRSNLLSILLNLLTNFHPYHQLDQVVPLVKNQVNSLLQELFQCKTQQYKNCTANTIRFQESLDNNKPLDLHLRKFKQATGLTKNIHKINMKVTLSPMQ